MQYSESLDEGLDTHMEGRANYINDVKTLVEYFRRVNGDPGIRSRINPYTAGIAAG
jgi:hypothetical protein